MTAVAVQVVVRTEVDVDLGPFVPAANDDSPTESERYVAEVCGVPTLHLSLEDEQAAAEWAMDHGSTRVVRDPSVPRSPLHALLLVALSYAGEGSISVHELTAVVGGAALEGHQRALRELIADKLVESVLRGRYRLSAYGRAVMQPAPRRQRPDKPKGPRLTNTERAVRRWVFSVMDPDEGPISADDIVSRFGQPHANEAHLRILTRLVDEGLLTADRSGPVALYSLAPT